MREMKSLKCTHCAKSFDRMAKDWRYDIKCGAKDFFCSKECAKNYKFSQKRIICEQCGIDKLIPLPDFKKSKSGIFFCSRSCRTTFYNKKKIHVTEDKGKDAVCLDCGAQLIISKYVSSISCRCPSCREKQENELAKLRIKFIELACIKCGIGFHGQKWKRYCDACRKIINKESGLKSSSSQSRRSKNEVLFFNNLSLALPKYNITNNEQFFIDKNGNFWDADIILHDLKIAIHWNGNWHHKKLTKKHSVAQVQSRDKIKYSVVENAGYVNYIINDLGKFNENKVKEELEKFLTYINI